MHDDYRAQRSAARHDTVFGGPAGGLLLLGGCLALMLAAALPPEAG